MAGRDFLKEVVLEKQRAIKETKRIYPEEELRLKLEEPHIYRPFKDSISGRTSSVINHREGGTFLQTVTRSEDDGVAEGQLRRGRATLASRRSRGQSQPEKMASLPTSDYGRGSKLKIIGELKKASPSEGLLRENFDPIQISRIYENCGCSAISILTEEKFFLGKIGYLRQVRKIVNIPILRKDFIFEPYQLYESKFFGADAVLLLAELLTNRRLSEFLSLARRLELDCLVEVNNLEDLRYSLDEGAQIIGVNNRNLHTFDIDEKSGLALLKHIPKDKVVVLESGIKTHRQYLSYKKLNVNAFLIGSAFMKADNIKEKIREIVEGKPREPKKKLPAKRRKTTKKLFEKGKN